MWLQLLPFALLLLALFVLLAADKEKRDWKWKLRWALRQLNNLKGIENDTASSHAALWQAAASIAIQWRQCRGTGSVAILQSLAFQEQFSWQHDYNLAFLCHRQSQVCCLRQLEALQLSLQLVLLWQLRYQFQESHLQ